MAEAARVHGTTPDDQGLERHRPPAGRRADYRLVDADVLDAAAELFAVGGPEAVTVSGVAERAGVSRATVHRHVGTRSELLWAVTARLLAELGGERSGGLAGQVEGLVDRIVGDPARSRAALAELAGIPGRVGRDSDGPGLLEREVAMMRILAGGPAGRAGIDPEVLAVINVGGLLLWSVLCERGVMSGGAQRYRAEIVRLLLHGGVDPDHVPDLTAPA